MDQLIENRLTKLETKLDIAEVKIHDMNSLRDAIVRLVTIQENQEERNRGQEERNKKFDAIYEEQIKINEKANSMMESINTNLNLMNEEMRCTSQKVSALEVKLDEKLANSKKDSDENDGKLLKRLHEINDKSKVDIIEILKKTVVPLLGGGLLFYLMQAAGIINL